MKILGLEKTTPEQIEEEIRNGGKFIIYRYCISVVLVSFTIVSPIYFIREDESRTLRGFKYCLISLFLGWWSIPWGIISTIQTIIQNFSGGLDVTSAVLDSFTASVGNTSEEAEEFQSLFGGKPDNSNQPKI